MNFTNTFGPMNRARNSLNRTLAAGPQIKQQRLQNTLAENKLAAYNQKQKAMQNALSQGGNTTASMFEFYQRTDPAKAQGIANTVLNLAKKMHGMGDTSGAAKYVTDNLGLPAQFKGDDEYEIQLKDGRVLKIFAEGGAPQILKGGKFVPMEGGEMQTGMEITLLNPTTGMSVEATRGTPYYEKAIQMGYQEGIPEEQDSPKTAVAAFLQNNPNATTEEIISFTKRYEQGKAEGRAAGKKPDEMTKREAMDEITDIKEKRYKIKISQNIMDTLGNYPQAIKLLEGKGINIGDPDAKRKILDFYQGRLDDLYKIVGKSEPKKKEKVIASEDPLGLFK